MKKFWIYGHEKLVVIHSSNIRTSVQFAATLAGMAPEFVLGKPDAWSQTARAVVLAAKQIAEDALVRSKASSKSLL